MIGNISSRFSGNSKANASELPENLEDMLPRYCRWLDHVEFGIEISRGLFKICIYVEAHDCM